MIKLLIKVLGGCLPIISTSAFAQLYAELPSQEDRPTRVIAYTGFDFTSQKGYTGWAGATIALGGNLEQTGFRLALLGVGGKYQYLTEPALIKGRFEAGDALIGYGWVAENMSAKVVVGVNVQNQRLSPDDPTATVKGTATGAKVQVDFYGTPTDYTMVAGLGSYSTAFKTYYTDFKAGYQVFNVKELYFGPQLVALGNEDFNQWRFGAHLSGIPLIGSAKLNLFGGYLSDSRAGPGAYGAVSMNFDF
jgi:hypothetical protein